MTNHKTVATDRNYVISLLKALSISYIVGYWHLFGYTSAFPLYNNLFTNRLTMIILGLFTFLSGYLTGSRNKFSNRQEVKRFFSKRLLRIYPLYLLAIILFYFFKIENGSVLFKSLFLISMFTNEAPRTLWFVSMILIYYLISPILSISNKNIQLYSIVCSLILTGLLMCHLFINPIDLRILIYFPTFALGLLLGTKRNYLTKIKFKTTIFLFIVSLLASFINLNIENNQIILRTPMILFGTILIFLIFNKLISQQFNRKLFPLLVNKIAYASYCLYLFHRPIYSQLISIYFPKNVYLQTIYLFFICFPICLTISGIIQISYDLLLQKTFNNH